MTQEEMLTALYEKMAAEQDKYRAWLKGQPAAEVLNHAYEAVTVFPSERRLLTIFKLKSGIYKECNQFFKIFRFFQKRPVYCKRFYRGELEHRDTFSQRVLSEKPKFVQKREERKK